MNAETIVAAIRRPAVWITLVVTVILILAWYVLLWSPEGSKLSNVNNQIAAQETTLLQKQGILKTYESEAPHVGQYNKLLVLFATAVPQTGEQGQLTTELAALADQDKATLTAINIPASGTATVTVGLFSLPVTLSIKGTWTDCTKFLTAIYSFPRLITIQDFVPSLTNSVAGGSNNGVDIINPKDKNLSYTFNITGTAYYSAAISGSTTVTTTSP